MEYRNGVDKWNDAHYESFAVYGNTVVAGRVDGKLGNGIDRYYVENSLVKANQFYDIAFN